MAAFMNICGPVIGSTAYVDNQLVARDVAATLPEITPSTADLQAMGTMSFPVWQILENMELAITKIGFDMGLRSLIKPTSMSIELRFVQTVTDANGNTRNVSCKAFMRGTANKIPGYSVTVGEASENECTLMLTKYRLVIDGVDYHNIDRTANKLVIAGVDLSDFNNML